MAVAVLFVATGLHTVLRPTQILIMHPTNSETGSPTGSVGGVLSPKGARIFGTATILVGASLGVVLLMGRKD